MGSTKFETSTNDQNINVRNNKLLNMDAMSDIRTSDL